MTFELLIIFFCLIIMLESIYDQYIENENNQRINNQMRVILTNLNYIFRTH